MRTLALLFAASLPAFADEVDLTPRSRRADRPPLLIVRGEAGSDFAPYGFAGACLSYLLASGTEVEAGAGAGFPGLQLGLAARQLFGERGGYFLTELAIAGNTRVNRGDNRFAVTNSSLWGTIGFGYEQRQDYFSLSVVGFIASTFTNPTLHFGVHGGFGVGF